jgi:hypothetical protein
MNDRVGLIGVSVRSAAEALGPKLVDCVYDFYCDWDTEQAAPNRCVNFVLESFTEALKTSHQGPTAWLTTGGLDLEPSLLTALQIAPHRLLGFSLAAVRFCKDPSRWSDKLTQAGRATLPIEFGHHCPPGRWHLKRNWPESPAPWFWQLHADGILGSAIFLAQDSRVELVGCSRLFVHSDWRYQGNVASVSWPGEAAKETLVRIVEDLADELQPRGLFGIDFILGPQLWPLEINPRPTASVEVLAALYRRNLFLEHVRACWPNAHESSFDDPATQPHSPFSFHSQEFTGPAFAAKRVVYNSNQVLEITSNVFRQLQQFSTFQPTIPSTNAATNGQFRLADLPQPTTRIPAHEPICSILYQLPHRKTDRTCSADEIWAELGAIEETLLRSIRMPM